jgi:hypothetical protein
MYAASEGSVLGKGVALVSSSILFLIFRAFRAHQVERW